MQSTQKYNRYCPGESHIRISDAVCFGRRRVNFPKCQGCQFNDDEIARRQKRRVVAHGLVIQEREDPMLEKVFKAYDVRGTYPDPLNEEMAWRIGFAAGTFLRSALRGTQRGDAEMNRVVVGRDMRKSSPSLQNSLMDGIRTSGASVIEIGMIDTSQIYFAVNHFKCCGGVQTTASHNPAQYNGFKICGLGGKPIGEQTGLHDIRMIAENTLRHEKADAGPITHVDLTDEYRQFVLGKLKLERPIRAVIDASNGMAGRWIPLLFNEVENLHIDALNLEHKGEFVHDPNPLVASNLKQLQDRVIQTKADLGVCFDGDADRCMLVDENAKIIECDLLTGLLAQYFLEKHPKSTIVYDLRSSRIVSETVEAAGGKPHRERVGHAFMKKALADTQAVFGGELSGHFYFKENWYCDSGMLAFVHVLNVLSRDSGPISSLIAPFRKYHSSGERNFINEQKDAAIRKLSEIFQDAKVDYLDGITIQYADWWFNVRKSNTEPLLRLNMEANSQDLLREKLSLVSPELGKPTDH